MWNYCLYCHLLNYLSNSHEILYIQYIYVKVYIYTYIYTEYIHRHIYICVCLCVYIYNLCIYIVYIHIYIYIYCIYICTVYMYTHTHTHTHKLFRKICREKYFVSNCSVKNEMGGACGAYGGRERCAQGSGGET